MAGDIDREGVEKAYERWAPVYDLVFGKAAACWLKHDPEKWEPVFRKDHAQTKR